MLLLCLLMASAAALTAQDWVGYNFAASTGGRSVGCGGVCPMHPLCCSESQCAPHVRACLMVTWANSQCSTTGPFLWKPTGQKLCLPRGYVRHDLINTCPEGPQPCDDLIEPSSPRLPSPPIEESPPKKKNPEENLSAPAGVDYEALAAQKGLSAEYNQAREAGTLPQYQAALISDKLDQYRISVKLNSGESESESESESPSVLNNAQLDNPLASFLNSAEISAENSASEEDDLVTPEQIAADSRIDTFLAGAAPSSSGHRGASNPFANFREREIEARKHAFRQIQIIQNTHRERSDARLDRQDLVRQEEERRAQARRLKVADFRKSHNTSSKADECDEEKKNSWKFTGCVARGDNLDCDVFLAPFSSWNQAAQSRLARRLMDAKGGAEHTRCCLDEEKYFCASN